jgi:hypothetical protein
MSVPLVMCIQCMEAELADFLGDREA